MKTAVCTHDSFNYNFAKESYIYADWLHVHFIFSFPFCVCACVRVCVRACVCVFNSVILLGFAVIKKIKDITDRHGCSWKPRGRLHSETFSCRWRKHFLNLFLLVSQCYQDVSNFCACTRENRSAVPQWKCVNKALIFTIPKEEWHKFHMGVSARGK